jgi:AAA domain (Cdc48 subfamily)
VLEVDRPPLGVLFDEIEKAHADVFNILLQILDDGRLTAQAHARTRLVDQVDRLVGQEAVADVAIEELRGRDDRLVQDANPDGGPRGGP